MHTRNAMPIIVIIIIITPWGSKAVTYISTLLFALTDHKPPQLLPVFAHFNFIDITIFWSKSNTVCLCLLLIFIHTIRTDAVTCTSPAACNISIPSPVSARRGHYPPPPPPEPITSMYTVVNLMDPDPTSPVTAASVLVPRTSRS